MTNYLRILISLFFVFGYSWTYGQLTESAVRKMVETASENDLLEKNNVFLIEGDIFFADIVADKLLSFKPDNSNYNYRKGFSLFELTKNYERAIPYFKKAIVSVSNNYDMFSTKEKSAPSDAYLYLGKCYHLDENLDEAEKYYSLFIANSRKKSELLPLANLYLSQCSVARKLMNNPVSVKVKNVGPIVNSAAAEYSPVVSLDGSALYFTSRRPWSEGGAENFRDLKYNQFGEDIYVSYVDFDLAWTDPLRLNFCEPDRNEATVAVSTDERRIHLYLDSQNNGDLFYSDFYSSRFNSVQPIDIAGVNTEFWEPHCTMSNNLERFFFVSNRPGGYGGRDIYYCLSLGDGTWSKPINMGPKINSAFDEDSPFISFDNRTLYYSTNGPKSMGGFDIMKSTLLADGTWADGENLGYPFNCTNDDLYYTATVEGLLGYLTSSRKGGKGEKDIYEIHNEHLGIENISALTGTINKFNKEAVSDAPSISINVTCSDCETNKNPTIYPRQRDGFFLSRLEPCKTYLVEYVEIKTKTVLFTDSFKTSCNPTFQEISRELLLNDDGTLTLVNPLVVQTNEVDTALPPTFEDFDFVHFFGYNKNLLSTKEGDFKMFLDKLEAQIKNGRKASTLNIYASASKVPTQSFKSNEELAQKRALNTQKILNEYLANKPKMRDKINIVVMESKVQGPDYAGDRDKIDTYTPFQYVRIEIQ